METKPESKTDQEATKDSGHLKRGVMPPAPLNLNEIYNESCLETMSRMPDQFVDLVLTSPPYNINLRIRGDKYCRRSKREDGPCNKYQEYSDDLPIDDYFDFQKQVLEESMRVGKLVFYIIQPLTGNKEALFGLIGHFSKELKEIIVWDKKTAEPAIGEGVLNSQFEFILVFDKSSSRQRKFKQANFGRGTLTNIWSIGKSTEKVDGHKATFPRLLVSRIIDNFTKEGEIVYDPFSGTGTTAMVAALSKRNYMGSEITAAYCEAAENRIKRATAQACLC